MTCVRRGLARFSLAPFILALAAGTLGAGAPALAQDAPAPARTPAYSFAPPPSAQANRVYSVNSATGEVAACQFERPEGNPIGVTKCFTRGDGAGPQKAGAYELVTTGFSGETGVFRVNRDTGEMSICYVRNMPKVGGGVEPTVVCTPPAG
ncbi:hypothetical protein [Ancylobacter terrae]|uniref:hypothetical protein n=1 Tax=Ancylobacter sp. sgz301288 TaxID=3342077 RepID=UPI00385E5BEE